MRANTPEDFWGRVEKTGSCWLWRGNLAPNGYGHFGYGGRDWLVHRWAWEQLREPIVKGLELDHLCSVRNCVNPDHLEPVNHHENLMRGDTTAARHAAKTHCPKGHPLSGENLYMYQNRRHCRECRRQRAADCNSRIGL